MVGLKRMAERHGIYRIRPFSTIDREPKRIRLITPVLAFHEITDSRRVEPTYIVQEAGEPPLAVISGTATKKQERKLIVERFAPKANRGDMPDETFAERLADPVQLLISTDVLSEGQNLQDAGYLINADLHWNPVRMI